jgi:hypothetical protein
LRQRIASVVVVACTVGALGCGGDGESGSEVRAVRAAVRHFVMYLAERDYEEVCRIVTKEVRASWAEFARRNPKHYSTAGCPAFAEDFYGQGTINQRTLRRDMRAIERGSVQIKGDKATFTAHPSDRRPGKDDKTVLKKVGGRWLLGD